MEARLISPCFFSLYIEGRCRIFSTPSEVLTLGTSLPHQPSHEGVIYPVDNRMAGGEELELLPKLLLQRHKVLLMGTT